MIPHQAALLLWVPISALLMMDRNNARGFSLAFILGLLILPSKYGIELPGLPDIAKENVASIGVLIGTVLFHPRLFDRFRLGVADFVLFGSMGLAFITSYVNDFGSYDGAAQSFAFFLNFFLPILLARIHLGTPRSLRTFLLALVAAGVFYMPFALWEFRMSPQIHQTLYGYFQHVFQQHYRGGFWRPIVCFSHALELGRFFAFTAFLALLPMRKDLVRYLGKWGNFVFLPPLFGLALSQSYGPYLLFVLLCGGYFAVARQAWLGYLVPALALLWLFFVFMGYEIGYGAAEEFSAVNPDRAQSFGYRLFALREYRSVILNRPWFGHGGWGHGRIEGRATDAEALIHLLGRGFFGAAAIYVWWGIALHGAYRVMRRTRNVIFGKRARAVAVLASLSLTISVIDAALDQHVMLTAAGLLAIDGWLRTKPRIGTLHEDIPLPALRPLVPKILPANWAMRKRTLPAHGTEQVNR